MKKRFRNPNKIDLPHDIDQESLLSLYDRESKDLELFNSIDAEVIKLSGSKLLYYKVFINENYDRVYLEERNKVIAKDPIVVWASFDPKPIEETVSEFGLELTNDQVFVFNKSYVERAIGRAPQPGDVVESPVQNIKYEIYEVQEDSFEVYGVFHYNCYGRVLRDSLDVVDEPALETFEEVGADLLISRRDYGDLMSASLTNADVSVAGVVSPPVIVPDPDEPIRALFANDEVGAWYDPSDSETVFQDAAGTTPATVGDPVGLILDKSKGLELGAELVDTANDASAWGPNGSNVIEQDGDAVKITYVDDSRGGFIYLTEAGGVSEALSASKRYVIQFEAMVSGGSADVDLEGFNSVLTRRALTSSYQTYKSFSVPDTASPYIRFANMSAGEVAYIRNITVKELPGNHATQSTSAARPVLQQSGGLYYLDFDGVDDCLLMGDVFDDQIAVTTPGKWDLFVGAQMASDGTLIAKNGDSTHSENQRQYVAARFQSSKFALGAYWSLGSTSYTFVQTDVSYSYNTNYVLRTLFNRGLVANGLPSSSAGDRFAVRVNGADSSSTVYASNNLTNSIQNGTAQLSIGGAFGTSGPLAGQANMQMYGMVMFAGLNQSTENAGTVESYLATKSGVTLSTAPVGP